MMKKVIYRSVFSASPQGHGGNRRTAQINELFATHIAAPTMGSDQFGTTLQGNVKALIAGSLWSTAPWSRFSHPKALRNAGIMRTLSRSLDIDPDTLVVFDSWLRAYEPLFGEVRAKGGKVALFPQNIDSLSPARLDPMSGRIGRDWFPDEIRTFGSADLVCCISREEQWLLSLYGIDSCFLPYFPPRESRADLAELRKARSKRSMNGTILIMGTASNAPTLLGMQAMAARATDIVAAGRGRKVQVVGFGTEVLRSASLPPGFEVLGGVSKTAMDACLLDAEVAVCFQPGTTGALTRIPELLCAGVPVIANNIAARTYHNCPGVLVVESMSHLMSELHSFSPQRFEPPSAPVDLELELIRRIGRL